MGLFNIFKKKELSPEEAYEAALDHMQFGSWDEKNALKLEKACEGCPDQWQGRLLLALMYLVGSGTDFDEEKGLAYLKEAREICARTGSQVMEEFCGKLEEDCGNLFSEYGSRVTYIRKLGCVMMLEYGRKKAELTAGMWDNDDELWRSLFLYCREMEQKMPFFLYQGMWNAENDKDMYDNLFPYMKRERDNLLSMSREDVTPKTVDTWLYVMGYGLALGSGSPFAKLKGKPGMLMDDTRMEGLVLLWEAAFLGCLPAIHMIGGFLLYGNMTEDLCYAFSCVDPDDRREEETVRKVLLGMLKMASDKGDAEARELLEDLM